LSHTRPIPTSGYTHLGALIKEEAAIKLSFEQITVLKLLAGVSSKKQYRRKWNLSLFSFLHIIMYTRRVNTIG
jgi:hypothetical protein